MRYHIADKGGVLSFDEMWNFLREQGVRSLSELELNRDKQLRNLPFVYVFGRANFTVSYYGANIYPGNVTVGLEQPEIMAWMTGKFVLETQETEDGDKYLHIAEELLPGIEPEAMMAPIIADVHPDTIIALK